MNHEVTPLPQPERCPTAPSLGYQLTADFHGCDARALDDVEGIRAWLLEAARRAGATVVGDHVHRFNPHGVSGAVILAESHLAIHTWPEHGFAALDLFTCGRVLNAEPALDFLRGVFKPAQVEVRSAERGMAAPPRSSHVEAVSAGRRLELMLKGPWLLDEVTRLPALGGISQRVRIGDFTEFGRGLVIDGEVQLAEGCDAAYTRALVWPAALRAASRKRWLIIGGGDGAAAREALRFTDAEEVVVADVSALVVEQTRRLIPSFWDGCESDPRLQVQLRDGLEVLRDYAAGGRRADVIVLDLMPPYSAGSDLFQTAAAVLAPGGVFVAQLGELSGLRWEQHREQVEALGQVFRRVSSYRTPIEFFGYAQSFALGFQEERPPVPESGVETLLERLYGGEWRSGWSQAWHEGLFTLPAGVLGE
jgi:spermidine synthase